MFQQMIQNDFENDEEDTPRENDYNDEDDNDEDDDEINGIESGNLDQLQQNLAVVQELTSEEKLALANRSNEIYCQQLKYMKDHFESLRSLLEDKENIIENLMLRYDSGVLRLDNNYATNLNPNEINPYELKKKAEALAQRTIMENFDLREMINELRDENFQLTAEIYARQEIINRQAIYINKLTKQELNNNNNNDQEQDELESDNPASDHPANDPHAIAIRQAREQKHRKQQSSIQAPNIFGNNDQDTLNTNEREDNNDDEKARNKTQKQQNAHKSRQQSLSNADIFGTLNIFDDNHLLVNPSQTEEAKKIRESRANKSRKESIVTPNLFDDNNKHKNNSQSEEAQKIRQQRAQKHHRKQSSAVAPTIFNEEEEESDNEQQHEEQPSQANKRRGSKQFDPKFSDEAIAKRQTRQEKHHRKKSSLQTPNIFNNDNNDNINNDNEAQIIRDQRSKKHQQRKSSVIIPRDLFGNQDEESGDDNNNNNNNNDNDDNKQKKRRKSRIIMLSNAVGDKGHFSDEEDKDTHRITITKTTKTTKAKTKKGHKKLLSMSEQNGKKEHHKRKSSVPIPDLGLDDPTIQLEWNQEEIKSLQTKLETQRKDLDNVQNDLKSTTQALQIAIQSKSKIAESTSIQIDRFTRVLNTLLGIEQYREIVKLLLKESINWQ